MSELILGGRSFASRLFLGTGKYSSMQLMRESVIASSTELVTVALKRVQIDNKSDEMLVHLNLSGVQLMPNTSGARSAAEAVFAAELAREALETNWLKLEIHPDPRYLLPDPLETYAAAEQLVKKGFIVLPYVNADPVLCKRLEEVGVAAVMPLGSPIGSNRGLKTRDLLQIIIEQSQIPVVIDAGLGSPSHAAEALEMGADAVLVNTAIAVARDPVEMSIAFKLATDAGRRAYEAGLGLQSRESRPSSPRTMFFEES